jgi:cysteine synthase B
MERQRTLEAFGAEVVLTTAEQGTDGAIRMAQRMLEQEPDRYFMPNQFANPANPRAHYQTTGPEILRQTAGDVDVFVAGMGTTGTLMGVGRFLKEHISKVKIVGVEPTPGHKIQGLKNMSESIVPPIFDRSVLDEIVTIGDEEAFEITRQLACKEGIFAGMSSGAAVAGALRLARQMDCGTIVTVICDRGDRYLSTALFRSTCGRCPP